MTASPIYQDRGITLYCGDALETLRGLPDGIVQCCVTSPPYWGLRDYSTGRWEGGNPGCDHLRPEVGANATSGLNAKRNPDGTLAADRKSQTSGRQAYKGICRKCGAIRLDEQIGLENTPDAYVTQLVAVFREVRRVLAKDGTLWLNLGDSFAAKGMSGGGKQGEAWADHGVDHVGPRGGKWRPAPAGYKAKDLVGIPWMAAFALRADDWYLRSDIIWSKPNPMPESVTDRPTRSHEYVFLLSKSARYFYDAAAIAEPASYVGVAGMDESGFKNAAEFNGKHGEAAANGSQRRDKQRGHSKRHAGFNDRWDAMSKAEQCSGTRNKRSVWTIATHPYAEAHFATYPEALVEPCILAGSAIGDIVLDPFNGSGTTGAVAERLGRKYIGIELNPEYIPLTIQRLAQPGLFTTAAVESSASQPSAQQTEMFDD